MHKSDGNPFDVRQFDFHKNPVKITMDLGESTTTEVPRQEHEDPLATFYWTPLAIIKSIIFSSIILICATGNSLVLIAVCIYHKCILSKSVTNYFITNLAIADLLVSVTVMPFSAYQIIFDRHWRFGPTYCQIWSIMDIWYCEASILSLCAVTFDRYVGVTKPLQYPALMTRKRALILICLVWIISFLISGLPILLWEEMQHLSSDYQCRQTYNLGHVLLTCIGAFYIPMVFIAVLYWRIYLVIRKFESSLLTGRMATVTSDAGERIEGIRVHYGAYNNGNGTRAADKTKVLDDDDDSDSDESTDKKRKAIQQLECKFSYCKISPVLALNMLKFQKEKRVAFHLSLIVGIFIASWFPFFTLLLLRGLQVIPAFDARPLVQGIFLWLGYLNSCLNPFIYVSRSRQFKSAFRKMYRNVRTQIERLKGGGGQVQGQSHDSSAVVADTSTKFQDSHNQSRNELITHF